MTFLSYDCHFDSHKVFFDHFAGRHTTVIDILRVTEIIRIIKIIVIMNQSHECSVETIILYDDLFVIGSSFIYRK